MHKLKLAQTIQEASQPSEEPLLAKDKNPFAALRESESEEDEDYDDSYLNEKERYFYKRMTKAERKEHKRLLKEYENASDPLYEFPKPTIAERIADPIKTAKEMRLHKYSKSRNKLTYEMVTINARIKVVVEEQNQLSYMIDQKMLRLVELVRPYVDEHGNVPDFEDIPPTLTENPYAMYQDILSQTKDLVTKQKDYADLKRQYEYSRDMRDLFSETIKISLEETRLKEKQEMVRELNSNALRETLVRRRKEMEDLVVAMEANRELINDGAVDHITTNRPEKVNDLFNVRFKYLVSHAPQQASQAAVHHVVPPPPQQVSTQTPQVPSQQVKKNMIKT
jgi:hypothetical protein